MTSDLHGRKPTRTSSLKVWRLFTILEETGKQKTDESCEGPPGSVHRKGGSGEVSRLLWLLVLFFVFFPQFWEIRQRAGERSRPQGWRDTTGRLKYFNGMIDE